MGKLIKADIPRAKTFQGTFQFINDLCGLMNEENFKNHTKKFVPRNWY